MVHLQMMTICLVIVKKLISMAPKKKRKRKNKAHKNNLKIPKNKFFNNIPKVVWAVTTKIRKKDKTQSQL
jgi:hypothetical protein